MKIDGKVAIVIGGGRGIGAAFCEALLEKGAKLCIGDVNETWGNEVTANFKAKFGDSKVTFVKCDVTKEEDIKGIFQKTIDTYGPVDIVVNNVGLMHEFKWELMLDINVGGVMRCTQVAMSCMGKDKGGKGGVLVHMASLSGLAVDAEAPMYSASKSAVITLTRAYSNDAYYESHGIRINCLCPGLMDTPSLDDIMKEGAEERINFQKEAVPILKTLKRLPLPLVASGLIKLIEDDEANGKVMRITNTYGQDYYTFPEQPTN